MAQISYNLSNNQIEKAPIKRTLEEANQIALECYLMTTLPQTKICRRCKEEKPLTDFYSHEDRLDHRCKTCTSIETNNNRRTRFTQTLPKQQIVIDKLKAMGIFAAAGKQSSYRFIDVVAWGCVTIEIKYSQLGTAAKGFQFSFTPRQRRVGINTDIIVLVCDYGQQQTYHVFDQSHPAIIRTKQENKSAYVYLPDSMAKHRKGNKAILTDEIMMPARDRWELIEAARQAHIKKMLETA